MCSDAVIQVENLSKCYTVYANPRDRLKQFILPRLRRLSGHPPKQYSREFWALKNISLQIHRGETVGIIGRNGSGKSTLLQLICGTVTPTSGNLQIRGRIAALLELGSGFNPEFTGRENVYLNGALLGMMPHEIDSRFDAIAGFADIGDFIEQPVKTYSSGMFVRLAFAINIMSKPEIMIVDEALAVGDMNFQAKCMTALTKIQDDGATILFVSHDVGAVKSLCSKAVYLEHGELKSIGPAPEISEHYIRHMRTELTEEQRRYSRVSNTIGNTEPAQLEQSVSALAENNVFAKEDNVFAKKVSQFRYGSGGAMITNVEMLDAQGQVTSVVGFNDSVRIRIYFNARTDKPISANVNILDERKLNVTSCTFMLAGIDPFVPENEKCYVADYALRLPLREGNYSIRAQLVSPGDTPQTTDFIDVVNDALVFKMEVNPAAVLWSYVYLFPSLNLHVVEPVPG